jgi:hypothetical protein
MRRAGWLLVPVMLVLLGVVLLSSRSPAADTAFTLRVGSCFDVPPGNDAIGDVPALPCDGPHDAEVFVAEDYAAPGPSAGPWPGEDAFRTWVADRCVNGGFPAYFGQPYASRPDLKVAYLFPGSDAWARGERRVTCFVAASGGGRLPASVNSAAPSAS